MMFGELCQTYQRATSQAIDDIYRILYRAAYPCISCQSVVFPPTIWKPSKKYFYFCGGGGRGCPGRRTSGQSQDVRGGGEGIVYGISVARCRFDRTRTQAKNHPPAVQTVIYGISVERRRVRHRREDDSMAATRMFLYIPYKVSAMLADMLSSSPGGPAVGWTYTV